MPRCIHPATTQGIPASLCTGCADRNGGPQWGEAQRAVPRRYVRLHLLEGVAAFHAGDAPAARARLLVRPAAGRVSGSGRVPERLWSP